MKKNLSLFSRILILTVFTLICIGVLITGIAGNAVSVMIGAAGAVVFVLLLVLLFKGVKNCNRYVLLLCLTLLCVAVKTLAVCFIDAAPVADYDAFYEFALSLSQKYVSDYNSLYLSLFPHVFGYAEFLSFVFFVFGAGVKAGVILNVVLSVLSMILIFLIALKIGGERLAFVCSLLWILLPSQSLWNNILLSEPLYVTILLAIWCLALYAFDKEAPLWRTILLALVIGLCIVWFDMIRPVGIIVLAALLLWVLVVNMSSVTAAHLIAAGLILCLFFGGKVVAGHHIEQRIGTETGGFSWYNVNVGLSEASDGKWNEADWNRLMENVNRFAAEGRKNPAEEAQKLEKGLVWKKITHLKHPFVLLKNKFSVLLGEDHTVVDHLAASQVPMKANTYAGLKYLTDGFYFMMVLVGIAGCLRLFKKVKDDLKGSFILLYTVGLTMAHMLVEVQGRYHYSLLLGFLFVAGYGLCGETQSRSQA